MTVKIVEHKNLSGHLILEIIGSIYSEEAPYFKEMLVSYLTQNVTSLSLDLEKMRYIDAEGLGALLCVKQMAFERGQTFQINAVSGILNEIFTVNRLTHLLPAQSTLAETMA